MRRGLLLAVLALGLTACGSTAPVTGQAVADGGLAGTGPGGAALGGPAAQAQQQTAGGAAVTAASGSTGTAAAAGGAGTGPTDVRVGSDAGQPVAGPSAAGPAQGLGVTASSVAIGIVYTTNGDAANAALGLGGVTTGDTLADAKAAVAEVNAHGGVAGRKLVAYYAPYDAQSTQTYAQQDAAACSQLTQDHHVIAVLGGGRTDTFKSCVAKSGAVTVDAGVIIDPDKAFFRQFPQYLLLGTMSQDRMMADYAASFGRTGWYGGWDPVTGAAGPRTKVGVLSFDSPTWHRPAAQVLLPALARAGHPVDPSDYIEIHAPASPQEQGPSVASIQSATLRLQQDGVTHVVLLDASGGMLLVFTQNARTQGYYPRLGINSGAGVQAIYDQGVVDKRQLAGASGIGWLPFLDLPQQDGDRYATAATRRCLDVMKRRTGQTFSSTNAASIALATCDSVFLVAQALDGAEALTPAGLLRAVEDLGGRFPSASVPQSSFGPQRHDGADLAWDLSWDGACTCVRYANRHAVLP